MKMDMLCFLQFSNANTFHKCNLQIMQTSFCVHALCYMEIVSANQTSPSPPAKWLSSELEKNKHLTTTNSVTYHPCLPSPWPQRYFSMCYCAVLHPSMLGCFGHTGTHGHEQAHLVWFLLYLLLRHAALFRKRHEKEGSDKVLGDTPICIPPQMQNSHSGKNILQIAFV